MIRVFISFVFLLLIAGNGQCGQKPIVFVSVVPQKYFVEQIAKDLVDVKVMVRPGASPATYEPRSSQMVALSRASIYFSIGVPFERSWLPRIAGVSQSLRVIHTDFGIEKRQMAAHLHEEDDGDAHHTGGHDSHQEGPIVDPHIWLSPKLVKLQAQHILEGLLEILPANAEALSSSYRTFLQQIDLLDHELRTILAETIQPTFLVFHPSWGYFAKEYGLYQLSVEMEGKEPGPGQLQELITLCRKKQIRTIFVQPQFSTKKAQLLAREIDGQVEVADSLAADWPENLIRVAHAINGDR